MDERRREERFAGESKALVGRRRQSRRRFENARIEDTGSLGLRICSGSAIAENDTVILLVGPEEETQVAKVVWVRKEGLIDKRDTGRPGQAYVAGCRLKARRRKSAKTFRTGRLFRFLFQSSILAAGIGLVGAAVYAISALVHLFE